MKHTNINHYKLAARAPVQHLVMPTLLFAPVGSLYNTLLDVAVSHAMHNHG
jgi:hypothetical protein